MADANQLNEEILKWLDILRKRPGMVVVKSDSYNLLVNYLEGYIDGISLLLNRNLRLEISKWYIRKNSLPVYNTYWTHFIPLVFEGNTENQLKDILLDVTEDFFKENPVLRVNSARGNN